MSKEETEGPGEKQPHVDKKFKVAVLYNGQEKHVQVEPTDLVQAVLKKAIDIFGSLPSPHTLSLFNESGSELRDSDTVEQAGVHPGDRLLLRPSVVKGG